MKACELCNRTDVTQAEHDQVSDKLNALSIEDFERVMTDLGVAERWETAFFCWDCLEYYL